MVQPTRSGLGGMGSGKRRIQLMINDAPQASKVRFSEILQNLAVDRNISLLIILHYRKTI